MKVETSGDLSVIFLTNLGPESSGNYSCEPSNAKPSTILIQVLRGEATFEVVCMNKKSHNAKWFLPLQEETCLPLFNLTRRNTFCALRHLCSVLFSSPKAVLQLGLSRFFTYSPSSACLSFPQPGSRGAFLSWFLSAFSEEYLFHSEVESICCGRRRIAIEIVLQPHCGVNIDLDQIYDITSGMRAIRNISWDM